MEETYDYKTVEIQQEASNSPVFYLYISGPSFRNALPRDFFAEFPKALYSLDRNPHVSVIVLSGRGSHFCSGIHLDALTSTVAAPQSLDRARVSDRLRRDIHFLQDAVTAIERCRKPVIAAIHGACIGAGIDIITACDIRYSTQDAFFSVKEVDLGITADLGTLQRLPTIVGYGHAMELALTARRFSASEANSLGLVSRVFDSREALDHGVSLVAQEIAGKPPLAVIGTKQVLQRSRDLTVEQSLDFVATLNSATVLTDDIKEAVSAQLQKRKPVFAKL